MKINDTHKKYMTDATLEHFTLLSKEELIDFVISRKVNVTKISY